MKTNLHKLLVFLLSSIFCFACANQNSESKIREDGLVTYVSFDKLDDNGNFFDEISGEPFYNIGNVEQTSGKNEKAASFDGESSLELHSFTAITGNNPFTLMCYATVNTDVVQVTTTNVLAGWGLEKDYSMIRLQSHYGKWCGFTYNKSVYSDFAADVKDVFHHVAIAYDGTNMQFYVDFVSVGTLRLRGNMDIKQSSLFIGGYKNNRNGWAGKIDELFIFNRSLSKIDLRNYSEKLIPFETVVPTNKIPIRTELENFTGKNFDVVPGVWNEFIYYTSYTTLNFKIYFPETYDVNKKYPFQLFLHGAMGNGHDVDTILNIHQECTTIKRAKTEIGDTIMMVPVSVASQSWVVVSKYETYPRYSVEDIDNVSAGISLRAVMEVLELIEENINIDKNRMYVSGVSAGAMGSYYLMHDCPNRWAGAIICCGRFVPTAASVLKDNHIWIFHGDEDTVIDLSCAIVMYDALIEAGAENVKYTVCEGKDHGISATYLPYESELINWLYAQVNTRR